MRVAVFNDTRNKPNVGVYSFGRLPGAETGGPAAQFEFDVSAFRDPAGQKQFIGLYGIAPGVRDWVCEDRRMPAILDQCLMLAEDLIRPHKKGESTEQLSHWLSISFRDHHGRWIAPAIAEAVANKLSDAGFIVVAIHNDIPKTELMKYQNAEVVCEA